MPTIRELMAGSGLPRLEARLLMMAASGFDRVRLIAHDDETLPGHAQAAFEALVARRRAGEPVAYLLGEREFYGRPFAVTPAVLIPRPETELLVDTALARVERNLPCRVVDLGTGSGAIAVTLALEAPAWQVRAVDLSDDALAVARGNAARLGATVGFMQGSWYAPLGGDTGFALIASNPPYIRADDHHLGQGDVRFEPSLALTDGGDGLACLREIAAGAPARLAAGGWLMVEHGFDQGHDCRALFAAAGLTAVETLQDLAGLDRVTVGQRA
ncbi:peptide chain release factor N(5)-glutamine methyltransferase [Crenobacter intestini]|uniref:Release factor glutamine methyltransferase n=1 Tax=Crenobacter intestini TaxID=2563443 RepID=A0A4T0ULZ2_9NEIS|nr:peptide chain release factor N(5)-glutamine methyltransferase [Crenobacter intestini]TIC79729.1 peptide chain release factor N(5)-glutamine methyltransferase [Crenobacter intestini]